MRDSFETGGWTGEKPFPLKRCVDDNNFGERYRDNAAMEMCIRIPAVQYSASLLSILLQRIKVDELMERIRGEGSI